MTFFSNGLYKKTIDEKPYLRVNPVNVSLLKPLSGIYCTFPLSIWQATLLKSHVSIRKDELNLIFNQKR